MYYCFEWQGATDNMIGSAQLVRGEPGYTHASSGDWFGCEPRTTTCELIMPAASWRAGRSAKTTSSTWLGLCTAVAH